MPTLVHTTAQLEISPGSSFAVTIPSTTAGNCIVVVVQGTNGLGSASITSMKLGAAAGNFGQLKAVENADTGAGLWTDNAVWADPNCAGSQTSVTIGLNTFWATASKVSVTIYEVSGLALTLAALLDQFSTGTGSGTSYSSGTSPATTQPAEFWVGAGYGTGTLTPPGGSWTDSGIHGQDTSAGCGSQVTSSTGTATYNGTTSSSGDWAALVVTLKGPAVAPGFRLPSAPAAGRSAARPGRSMRAAAPPRVPSPVQLPRTPARGALAVRRGHTALLAIPPVPLGPTTPSPFLLPRAPVRGTPVRARTVIRVNRGVIPVIPVIPSVPVSAAEGFKPWRHHGWPVTPIGIPWLDIGSILPHTDSRILPEQPAALAPEAAGSQAVAQPAGPGLAERARVSAAAAVTTAAAAAARAIPDSGALADPAISDAVAYWQSQRKARRKGSNDV